MPDTHVLLTFCLTAALFSAIPGPGLIYAAAQTMSLGRSAGRHSAWGFHIGAYVHIAAAALGVAILLQLIPALFLAMKLAGAAVLIWIGLRYIRHPQEVTLQQEMQKTTRRALRDSVLVEVLNPKSALFFFAFLPQFAEPGAAWPIGVQIFVLGVIANFVFLGTELILVECAHAATRAVTGLAARARLAQRIGGGILVALGINLAFARTSA